MLRIKIMGIFARGGSFPQICSLSRAFLTIRQACTHSIRIAFCIYIQLLPSIQLAILMPQQKKTMFCVSRECAYG